MFVVIVREWRHPVDTSCDVSTGWRPSKWWRAAERAASEPDSIAAGAKAAEWDKCAGAKAGNCFAGGFCVHLEFRTSDQPSFWAERKLLAPNHVREWYGQAGTSSS